MAFYDESIKLRKSPQTDAHRVKSIRDIFADVTRNYEDPLALLQYFPEETDREGNFNNGQTNFFRHSEMMRVMLKSFPYTNRPIEFLVAPSSIGCEAYGLAALSKMVNRHVRIEAFDRSATFTSLARVGAYPQEIAAAMEAHERLLIFRDNMTEKDDLLPVHDAVRKSVRFLDAQPFENFTPKKQYDVVMINNLFQYTKAEQEKRIVNVIERAGASLVIIGGIKRTELRISPRFPYVPLEEQGRWRRTNLAHHDTDHYVFWARNDGLGLKP